MLISQLKSLSQSDAKSVIKFFVPKGIQTLIEHWRAKRIHRRYAELSIDATFDLIYESNDWGRGGKTEASSGWGSTGKYAEEYCAHLKSLLRTYNIRSIVDLGCGDFNTGKLIAPLVQCYTGVDVAQQIITVNERAHAREGVCFLQADITRDTLPPADAAIVRQVFQHLTNSEIHAALDNVLRTYPIAFITEHIYVGRSARPNRDISHGPGTRVQVKSGVYIEQPPFSTNAMATGDIIVRPNEVLRTWVVKGTD